MSSRRKGEFEQDKEVIKIKEDFGSNAHEIITKVLPRRVIELTNLLKDETFTRKDVKKPIEIDVQSELNNKQRKKRKTSEDSSVDIENNGNNVYSTAQIPSNEMIIDAFVKIKSHILQFIDHVSKIKIWIQLNVPRIEDGNNFGVSIQEETLNELSSSEDSAVHKLESLSKYFTNRGKLISKCLKYPGIEDYRQSVIELDEREFYSAKLTLRELRDSYAILYDMIMKNFDRISKPRSEITSTLY